MSSSRLVFLVSLTMLVAGLLGGASRAAEPSPLETLRHVGTPIHEDTREGYKLSFQVMSEAQKRATLSEEERTPQVGPFSHHIMLILLSPEGRFVTGATVRYSVQGPDGNVQEASAVPMVEAYGVDVDMRAKGKYEVRAQISTADRQLTDSFTYERK